jgi:hypothetical protein
VVEYWLSVVRVWVLLCELDSFCVFYHFSLVICCSWLLVW